MAIKMVMFDMAGTTVQDNDDVNVCFQAALASTGLPVTRDDINAVMGLRKPDAIRIILEQKLTDKSKITDAYVNELHQVFLQKMIDFYKEDAGVKEIDGATAAFKELRANGIKVAINSGFSRDIVDTIIERLGWEKNGLIDVSVASDEVKNARPYPDMIQVAMKKLGIASEKEVAKVGDTPVDLEEGSNTGCPINIGVLSGAYTKDVLLKYPHTHIVNSIKDVPAIIIHKTETVGSI